MSVPDACIRIIGKYVRIVHCTRNCRTVASRRNGQLCPPHRKAGIADTLPHSMKIHGERRGSMPPIV